LHLVNSAVDARPATAALPVRGVEVRLRVEQSPAEARALRERGDLEREYTDGVCRVRLPELELYEVIVLAW
jgi:hypothetical protein